MKFTVNRDQIIGGLQKAASIIPLKAASVSLRSIWLKAEKDSIAIMATDANLEFTGVYPAVVDKPGLIGVHGKAFADLVNRWPSGPINITLEENSQNLLMAQGRRSYRLPVSSPEWFQPLAEWPEGDGVIWTGDALLEILDNVIFCIDDDEARDAMSCLYFKPGAEGKIDVCGLNGHQFAMKTLINDDLATLLGDGLLIQKKYLGDLKKWLAASEVELNLTEKRLFLKQLDGSEMLAIPRFTRAAFPDYNLFLSKLKGEGEGNLSVGRQNALDAMGRIMVFLTDVNRCLYLEMGEADVELIGENAESGSGRETLEAVYTGELKKIAFPNKNLMDIFNHFTSEHIDLHFTGQEGPCGITAPDDSNYLVVIMPMRMNENPYQDGDQE